MNVLLRYLLFFAGGILLHTWLEDEQKLEWLPLFFTFSTFVLLLVIFLLLFFQKGSRYILGVLMSFLFVCLGFIRTPTWQIPKEVEQISAYQAIVTSLPETRAKTHRIEVEIQKVKLDKEWKLLKVKVLLYIDKSTVRPHYGDELLVLGKPQEVTPPLNPDQFDFRKFLKLKRIGHQQYLRATDFVVIGQGRGVWYKTWAYRLSEWSDAALHKLIPYDREYGVAKAMILGLRDDMDNDLTQAYSAAGAVHVLSVSGFHVAIFIGIVAFLLQFLKKRKKGAWPYFGISLVVVWFYAILTGLSAPVVRAAVMFTLYLLAQPLGRKSSTTNALFASALFLLAYDPLLLFSVSFQLSYTALAGIIFLQPTIYQWLSFNHWLGDKIWAITSVALAAQLATFPLGAYYFHQFPTYFWLANPVVVFLATIMLPVGLATIALSWIPYLSDVLGWLLTGITWLLNQSVILVERLPFSVLGGLSLSGVEFWLICATLGCGLVAIFYREIRWFWAMASLSIFLFGIQVGEIYAQRQQKLLTIHTVPRHTVVSLIDGQRAILLADSAFFQPDQKPFNFFLKNFYIARGIRNIQKETLENPSGYFTQTKPLPFGKLLLWNGKKILIIERKIATLPTGFDCILIKNSAFRKREELKQVFGSQQLVFDGSNKTYLLDSLHKQAQTEKLNWHFVHRQGALVLE
ncbi:MAG: ComEC/Rec2 family competence protein [Runella sp.]